MHTSIATSILEQIKLRKLDVFFELEEKIMSKNQNLQQQNLEKSLQEVLEDPDAGTPEDKMRLFLIYFLLMQSQSQGDVDKYTKYLEVSKKKSGKSDCPENIL